MYRVLQTPKFAEGLHALKDRGARIQLARRLDKAQRGLLGDVKPLGQGVMEMREFFGSGVAHVLPATG